MPTLFQRMLAEAQAVAREWPLQFVTRETDANHYVTTWEGKPPVAQHHLVCRQCRQSVYCLSADHNAPGFCFNWDDVLAQVTAHVRQVHEDMLPMR